MCVHVQHHRCAANFFEIVKGFGMLPDKEIVDFALRVPRCIGVISSKWMLPSVWLSSKFWMSTDN